MPCYLCGRIQSDPPKTGPGVPSLWARAVVEGEQVLVCPICQKEHPEWQKGAERCPNCGGQKLSLQVGFRVCRTCGHTWEAA